MVSEMEYQRVLRELQEVERERDLYKESFLEVAEIVDKMKNEEVLRQA